MNPATVLDLVNVFFAGILAAWRTTKELESGSNILLAKRACAQTVHDFRVIRLDAAYWGLRLIGWIHATLLATTAVPWNPRRQQNRTFLPPTWRHARNWACRSAIERFFGRDFFPADLQSKGNKPRNNWIVSDSCLVDDDDWP